MKRNVAAVIVVGLVLTTGALAQPDSLWSRYYGGDSSEVLRGILVLADGSLILVGRCDSWGAGEADYWLLKTSASGDSLWSRFFGGASGDYPSGVESCSDAGFLLYGNTNSFGVGAQDIWLIRTDANGDSLWTRTFGGSNPEQTRSAGQTTDGGIYVAGWTESYGAGTEDFWLVRMSANGDSLWSRTFGGASNERCFTSLIGTDGNFYMAGDARSFSAGDKDVWLVAASPDGDSLWSRVYGGEFDEECRSIQRAADGGFLLIGGKNMDGADNWDVWVIRTDGSGNELWSRTYGGNANDFGGAAQILPDGGLVIGGDGRSFTAGDQDFWLLRLDADGDSLWSRLYGRDLDQVLWTLAVAPDGGYYLGGRAVPAEGFPSDFWLVKTGPDPSVNADEQFILHPSSFILSVYPNPFNPATTITFDLPKTTRAQLRIFDVTGRLVTTLADEHFSAGTHRVEFDGGGYPSGVCLAQLRTQDEVKTVKLILLK
ncbi:T9SS type A sorting domain-containing protein [bacterium]|nr:T9SS type A sorting domain-containing protein [bacterium]MBU1984828.1 T9SS type A sorting domain-containing protein [bacterium]